MAKLAERLGFAEDERIAVIHCDDIGMCHSVNVGAFEALENGPATCGSVMVPCPWFPEVAEYARGSPGIDLGVHLTLNAEWPGYRWGPVLGAASVPSLVDGQGCLPRSVAETLARGRPAEVEQELRAQIERALDAGIDVTHLDSHMGTCLLPPFAPIYARLAREFRVPLFVVRPDAAALAALGAQASGAVYEELLEELANDGIPALDGFDADSLRFAPGDGEAHNRARLARLQPGVSYLICHPARAGEELDAIGPDGHMRDFERRFYGGPLGRRALEEEGIRRIGMRALRDLVREAAR